MTLSLASWGYTIYYYIDEAGNVHATDTPNDTEPWEPWGEAPQEESKEKPEKEKEEEKEEESDYEKEPPEEEEEPPEEEEKEEEEEDLRKKQAKAAAKAAADATQIVPAIGLTEVARELTRTMPAVNWKKEGNQEETDEISPGEDYYYVPPGQWPWTQREGEQR